MSRKPSVDGETYTESEVTYDEAQHFITITRSEYNELIHDSELLRVLKANGVEDSEVWHITMETFYPDGTSEDDWRKDR